MTTEKREFLIGLDLHHLARLAMMQAEERGEDLSYEDAIQTLSN